jgi:hypothetical protein
VKSPFLKVSELCTPHIISYVIEKVKYRPAKLWFPSTNGLELGSWVRRRESGSRVKAIVIALAVGVTIVIVIFIVRDILSTATKL